MERLWGPGRSQRVTTPHCSCGTTQISRAWGAPPTDSVLEPELDTPQSQVKGGWLLLVCHFLDALQTYIQEKSEIHPEAMKNPSICQVARKDGEPVVNFVLGVGLEGGKLELNDGSLA